MPTRDGAALIGQFRDRARWGGQRTLLLDALQAFVSCRQAVREYPLGIPGRRFRADLAWPIHRVAVELQGGVYIGGHHVRGSDYEADCEKMLLAAAQGWRILPLTWSMLAGCMEEIVAALDAILACADPAHVVGVVNEGPP